MSSQKKKINYTNANPKEKKDLLTEVVRLAEFDQTSFMEWHTLRHMESSKGIKRLAKLLIDAYEEGFDDALVKCTKLLKEATKKV